MKIAIIGSPGSGKSTFAKKVHALLGIPLFHLDQFYWKPGWQRPDRQEFEAIHNQLCDKPEWIIEGMAVRHLEYRIERADMVIFLDVPLYVCLYRIFKRAFFDFGKVRDSSAPGCPDRIPHFEFLKYVIWDFRIKHLKKINFLLSIYPDKKIYIVHNLSDMNSVLNELQLGSRGK